MTDPTPFEDLIADDRLLDRLGRREPAGNEPLAALLSAVAAHADQPLTGRTRRRRAHSRRVFAAFAVITVGASGAGVAAAVTLPSYLPGAANRARIERIMDANAASNRPSVLLSRLGIPADADLGAQRGLVLVRRVDGQIVLVPVSAAARTGGLVGAAAEAAGALGSDLSALTGTPRPTAPGGKHRGSGGPVGAGTGAGTAAVASSGATTDGSGDVSSADDTAVPPTPKPSSTNSGKTGKGKVKVTTPPPPPPTITLDVVPPTPPSPVVPTATLALAPTHPDTGGATARKPAGSTEGEESEQADETTEAAEAVSAKVDHPLPECATSHESARPATPAQAHKPEQATAPEQPAKPRQPATHEQPAKPQPPAAEPRPEAEGPASSAPSGPSDIAVAASAASAAAATPAATSPTPVPAPGP